MCFVLWSSQRMLSSLRNNKANKYWQKFGFLGSSFLFQSLKFRMLSWQSGILHNKYYHFLKIRSFWGYFQTFVYYYSICCYFIWVESFAKLKTFFCDQKKTKLIKSKISINTKRPNQILHYAYSFIYEDYHFSKSQHPK